MNRTLISSVISTAIFAAIYYYFMSPGMVELMVVMLGFFVLDFSVGLFLRRVRKKRAASAAGVDSEGLAEFIAALGGQANIEGVSHEASRVKISLKDVDLVDQDQLKALEIGGTFLSGDQLQVTFGKQAQEVAQQINALMKGRG